MAYIDKTTNAYPVTEAEIRLANPETSFPTPFSPPDNFAFVFPAPTPAYNAISQFVKEVAPQVTDKGHYEQQYVVDSLPPEVIAANMAAYAANLRKGIVDATMQRLDDFVATRNYGSVLSACSYSTSTIPKFLAEGTRAVQLRDLTWTRCYEILAEIEAGTRPMPKSFADIEPDLPVLSWTN